MKFFRMRWKGKKDRETTVRKLFLWFPKNVNGEVRWLEFVEIKGYWWQGFSGSWYWESKSYNNKKK